MQVIRSRDAARYEPEKDWRRVCLCDRADISVEHFVKPPGHASPRHQHPSAQVMVVLEGELAVTTDIDGEHVLTAGDAAYIPGGEAHVVTNMLDRPSAGLDIFVPGRPFDFWLRRGLAERLTG